VNDQDWNISRKNFLRTVALGGIALQLPWLQSCTDEDGFPIPEDISPLNKEQFRSLQQVLQVLFPADGNGPSAIDIHADQYVIWVLNDELLDPAENKFILDKLDLFRDRCKEEYQEDFHLLADDVQNKFVTSISDEKWGKKWLSRLITLIFEALLVDPSYGGNTEEIGWSWVEHNPGFPRPNNQIQYPDILSLKHEV